MLNINHGHNKGLMDACKPLYEYSWFIEKVRILVESKTIKDAVGTAILEMPDAFLIKKFLTVHMSEVANMLSAELQENYRH